MKGKKRDKKIAPGGLKEVNGNIYLLKMGENFTGLSAVGKKTEKKKMVEDKENLITKIQTLKNTAKGSCVQGKEKHLSYHNSRRSKKKK